MRARSLLAWPAAGALVAVSVLVSVPAAVAEDPAGTFTFAEPTKQVEYGENWTFDFTSNYPSYALDPTVTSAGTPAGWWPGYYTYSSSSYTKSGQIGSFFGVAWLEPGTYSFGITSNVEFSSGMYATSNTAKLTVVPAALGVDLRVLADPSSPENAIVTARLTGKLAEASTNGYYVVPAVPSPAGTWSFTIADESGAVVKEHSVDRADGDRVFATSFYWTDAVPGESYTATAAFTPASSVASRYAAEPAAPFSYTAPEGRAIAIPDGEAEKPVDLPESSDFSVPVWWAVLIGLALAGLMAFVIVFAIRLGRTPATTKETS